jgi:hypothetical protein
MNVYLIYKAESLFVCTLYKFTFLNRSEPNFAHIFLWAVMVGYAAVEQMVLQHAVSGDGY